MLVFAGTTCQQGLYQRSDLEPILPAPMDLPGFRVDVRGSAAVELPDPPGIGEQPTAAKTRVFVAAGPDPELDGFLTTSAALFGSPAQADRGLRLFQSDFVEQELGIEGAPADPALGEESVLFRSREGPGCAALVAWRVRNLVLLAYGIGHCQILPPEKIREVAGEMNDRT
jgi:hypothetical protein